jgi:hypothetical protein
MSIEFAKFRDILDTNDLAKIPDTCLENITEDKYYDYIYWIANKSTSGLITNEFLHRILDYFLKCCENRNTIFNYTYKIINQRITKYLIQSNVPVIDISKYYNEIPLSCKELILINETYPIEYSLVDKITEISIIIKLAKLGKIDINRLKIETIKKIYDNDISDFNNITKVDFEILEANNLLSYVFSSRDLHITSYTKEDTKYYRLNDKYDMIATPNNIEFYRMTNNPVYKILVKNLIPADITVTETNSEVDQLLNFLLTTNFLEFVEYFNIPNKKDYTSLSTYNSIVNSSEFKTLIFKLNNLSGYKPEVVSEILRSANHFFSLPKTIELPDEKLECYIPYNNYLPINSIINEFRNKLLTCNINYSRSTSFFIKNVLQFLKIEFTTKDYFIYSENNFIFPLNTTFIVSGEPYIVESNVIIPVRIHSQELTPYVEGSLNNILNYDDLFTNSYYDIISIIETKDISKVYAFKLNNFYTTKLLLYLDKIYSNTYIEFYTILFNHIANKIDLHYVNFILENQEFIVFYLNITYIVLKPVLYFHRYLLDVEKDYTVLISYVLSNITYDNTPVNNTYFLNISDKYIKIFYEHGFVDVSEWPTMRVLKYFTDGIFKRYIRDKMSINFIFYGNYEITNVKIVKLENKEYIRINDDIDILYGSYETHIIDNMIYIIPNVQKVVSSGVFIREPNTLELQFIRFITNKKVILNISTTKYVDSNVSNFYKCYSEIIYNPIFDREYRELFTALDANYEEFKTVNKYPSVLISDLVFCNSLILLNYYTGEGFKKLHNFIKGGEQLEYINFKSTNIPVRDISQNTQIVKCLNNFFYQVHQKFLENNRVEPCILPSKLYLFRGHNGELPLTKDSIINSLKNQYVSFSSSYFIALAFAKKAFIILELDTTKDIIAPLGNIKFYSQYISSNAGENEFLLPLNTTFILTNDAEISRDHLVIQVKIHAQTTPDYTRFESTPYTGLYTNTELANYHA